MVGVERKSFEFKVHGPKLSGKLFLTTNFHWKALDAALRRATRRAMQMSGDKMPKFIRIREPVTVKGR